ncbi:tryptophan synthase alpha chain [Lachnospiraceae bacterium KM106-2]|nr:tryptophan synthase alpha chain [Lachnospiraceae bacterium KM106-2]
MTRISKAFYDKKAFVGFLTAGDPDISTTEQLIYEMERAGAGIVEIGIPFSDPIAEGPVIQEANLRALSVEGGCTINMIFELVEKVRKQSEIPLVFLTYLNPIYQYGYQEFAKKAKEAGLDGVIIPDLPYEEQEEILPYLKEENVDLISLIAPTSKERIQMIAKRAKGYIYLVSSMGVTGTRNVFSDQIDDMIAKIREVSNTPIAVGFGVNTPSQVRSLCEKADGVIVGSAIVKLIGEYGKKAKRPVYDYIKSMTTEME